MHLTCETRSSGVGRTRKVVGLLTSATVAIAAHTVAYAQTAPNSGPAPSSASQTTTDPNATESRPDIIVTAGKREEYLSKIAGGISVVTDKQLNLRAANSLSDYLALTPGVNLQSDGATGWGSVEIRGISPQSVGATVATYVDDIPVGASSALSRSGEYTPDIDPSDLERVEVLKGPQGTLYGASSLGGVIKYVTKGPSLKTTEVDTSEEMSFLDNGQPGGKVRAAISTPLITDTLGIRISGFYRHDAGFLDQLGPLRRDDVNYGNSWGVRGALRWKPVSNLTVDLTGSVENSSYHGYAVPDLDPLTLQPLYGLKDSNYRALDEGFRVRTDLFSATIKWQTPVGTLTSASSLSFQKPAETGDITEFYAPPANQPQDPTALISYLHPAGENGSHTDNQKTEELRFNSAKLGPVEFIVGGFYQHEKLKDGGVYSTYLPDGTIDSSADPLGVAWRRGTLAEYAGFVNATLYLTDRLDVTGGYRHSHIDQTRDLQEYGPLYTPQFTDLKFSENSDTYLGGIRWRPTDTLMFYGRAASGYRPGGGRSVPPGAPAGFAITYNPDSIWSYEAGVKYRSPTGKFTVDVDGFWIDWTDIQTLVFVGRYDTDGNGGKARSRGAEFQADYSPIKGLTLSGNTAYTDAVFSEDAPEIGVTKGERIFGVPKWTVTVAADYQWAINDKLNAYVGGDYEYRSNQLDFSLYTLPSYTLLNFHIGVETKHYNVNLFVKNATNKRVFIGDSSGYYPDFPPFQPVLNEPREIGIAFSQKF